MLSIWTTTSSGVWSGKHWYGRGQVEDKSPENIRACYAFLKSRPYQTQEDRERLSELETVRVMEAALDME